MKHTRFLLACSFFCAALIFWAVPVLAEEASSQESAPVSQPEESLPVQGDVSDAPLPDSSEAEEPSSKTAASEEELSSQPESLPASSVHSQEPQSAESEAGSEYVSKAPETSAAPVASAADGSSEESSSSEENVSAAEPSSRASSRIMPYESGILSVDPMQGGTLSDGEGTSRLYGLIAWIVIGAAALAAFIVLICSKRTRGNKMSSGRAYARKRSVGYKRKRLLDDKYYQNIRRKK